ncbi:MFS transporter [Pseudothermotoga thermarum]|uniref:MFS transporter n=1 Tax=Pseudothermotoga thermarum TaxID=119394 RepID=UPI0002EB877E|nr:MFS transporter [Pseudothermotoga thermarum]
MVRIWGTIGYSLTALLASWLVKIGFFWIFALMTFLLILLYPLSGQLEVKIHTPKKTISSKLPKSFFLFCLIVGLTVGFNYFNFVFLPALSSKKGYDISTVSLSLSLMAISEIPFLLYAEKIRKALTSKLLFASGVLVVSLRLILVSLSWSTTSLLIFQMLHGWTYIVIYYSSIYIMRENLSAEQLPIAQSFFWMTLMGFGPLFGSLFGGLTVQLVGVQAAYLIFWNHMRLFVCRDES